MKYFANGEEISEKEFNSINDRNCALVAEYEKTKDMSILEKCVFLTQI